MVTPILREAVPSTVATRRRSCSYDSSVAASAAVIQRVSSTSSFGSPRRRRRPVSSASNARSSGRPWRSTYSAGRERGAELDPQAGLLFDLPPGRVLERLARFELALRAGSSRRSGAGGRRGTRACPSAARTGDDAARGPHDVVGLCSQPAADALGVGAAPHRREGGAGHGRGLAFDLREHPDRVRLGRRALVRGLGEPRARRRPRRGVRRARPAPSAIARASRRAGLPNAGSHASAA